jgi:hypothetical protein
MSIVTESMLSSLQEEINHIKNAARGYHFAEISVFKISYILDKLRDNVKKDWDNYKYFKGVVYPANRIGGEDALTEAEQPQKEVTMAEYCMSKEDVKELAGKSSYANDYLRGKFPQVFEDGVDLRPAANKNVYFLKSTEACAEVGKALGSMDTIAIRSGGNYAYKAFILSSSLKWKLIKDDSDCLCLVPTRRS